MNRLALIAVASTLVACGADPAPPPAPSDRGLEPSVLQIEIGGPNLRFFCHGTYGVYIVEDDSYASPDVFVITDHTKCGST